MLVEHARNLMGIADASHAEYGAAGTPIVTLLSCSLVESSIQIEIAEASRLRTVYGRASAHERTHCNYGLEPAFAHITRAQGMLPSAVDESGEVRAVERTDHPFFIATLYQPQRSSTPERPHPVLLAFLRAASGLE